jgi:UTP--glucose-1-phosphate uridylyltransferase
VSAYGIISVKKQINPSLFQIDQRIVEKPKPIDAPSNLAIVGRYILSSKIMQALDEVYQDHTHGEIQLTDGIARMLHHNERVFAYKIQGERHDIGTPVGWVKSIMALALQDATLAPHIREYMSAHSHVIEEPVVQTSQIKLT